MMRPKNGIKWLAALAGCAVGCSSPGADDTVDPGGQGDPVLDPSPYEWSPSNPVSGESIDLAVLEDAIQVTLNLAREIRVDPVLETYYEFLDESTANCPKWYSSDEGDYWYGYCTINNGPIFSGYGIPLNDFSEFASLYTSDPGAMVTGDGLQAGLIITSEDGDVYSVAGNLYESSVIDNNLSVYHTSLKGSFAYDGPQGEGTWLGDGINPNISITIIDDNVTFDRLVQLEGGLDNMGGDVATAIFSAVEIYDGAYFGACPQEPGGVISLRRTDGVWYDVFLDGPPEFGIPMQDPTLCDGCGTAYLNNVPLGRVCADFSVLYERDP